VAIGTSTANYNNAFALGNGNTANSGNAIAMGYDTTSAASYAVTMGRSTEATSLAEASFAVGRGSKTNAMYSTAFGYYTQTDSAYSASFGRYNIGGGTWYTWVSTEPVFEIGIGADTSNKNNALTVRKNGNIEIPNDNAKLLFGTGLDASI